MNAVSWIWVSMDHNLLGANIFEDGHSIWERLDKGLANINWFLKFPSTRVYHMHCDTSDHYLLHINLLGLDPLPRKKIFRFEEMWLLDSSCAETVEAS